MDAANHPESPAETQHLVTMTPGIRKNPSGPPADRCLGPGQKQGAGGRVSRSAQANRRQTGRQDDQSPAAQGAPPRPGAPKTQTIFAKRHFSSPCFPGPPSHPSKKCIRKCGFGQGNLQGLIAG